MYKYIFWCTFTVLWICPSVCPSVCQ